MVRTKHAVATRRRKNRLFKRAAGNFGGRKNLWRTVKETMMRADRYAFRDRRSRKRDFRRLWITRISGALEPFEINYSRFMHGVTLLGKKQENANTWNRKTLSELAINDPEAFASIVALAKKAIQV